MAPRAAWRTASRWLGSAARREGAPPAAAAAAAARGEVRGREGVHMERWEGRRVAGEEMVSGRGFGVVVRRMAVGGAAGDIGGPRSAGAGFCGWSWRLCGAGFGRAVRAGVSGYEYDTMGLVKKDAGRAGRPGFSDMAAANGTRYHSAAGEGSGGHG